VCDWIFGWLWDCTRGLIWGNVYEENIDTTNEPKTFLNNVTARQCVMWRHCIESWAPLSNQHHPLGDKLNSKTAHTFTHSPANNAKEMTIRPSRKEISLMMWQHSQMCCSFIYRYPDRLSQVSIPPLCCIWCLCVCVCVLYVWVYKL